MNEQRKSYTLSIKLDPRAQDMLVWIEEALKWVAPDVRLSNAAIIRRAITAYVEKLEYITAPGDRQNGASQMGEASKLMNHLQPQPVYWATGEFPVNEMVTETGHPCGWKFLESQHRSASNKRGLDSLLKKGAV